MRNQTGVTLITLVITVVLLCIIAGLAITSGIDTYQNSKAIKFESYMKMIQKKVDIILEEGRDYTALGSPLTALTSEQNDKLRNIIINNTFVETSASELDAGAVRYFSSTDIEKFLEIKDVQDDVVINFANREVISLNGVEKDGFTHYVEIGLHQ